MGEATSLTKIHLEQSKCCKCATWPIQWLFKYKLLHFYLKAKNIWQMSDWNRKRAPNVRILVENCKLLEICTTQMHSHALFLTIIRSFNTWFNKKVTQIHTHQLESVTSTKHQILPTDLKEIYTSFKEELPNWTKSQKWK